MKKGRSVFITFIGILLFAGAAHADMMPVSQEDAESLQSPVSCERSNLQCDNISHPSNCICFADLDECPFKFLPKADAKVGQAPDMQNLPILTNEPNSLKFCLSALISLGLCCSAHWVKRLSLGFVPEWYHEGGPFQIGYSHALMPGTLCPAQACCFAQPYCMEDNHLPQYFIKTVTSIWRKSQFTPGILTSRGPPDVS
jgi:hypothetical protein